MAKNYIVELITTNHSIVTRSKEQRKRYAHNQLVDGAASAHKTLGRDADLENCAGLSCAIL